MNKRSLRFGLALAVGLASTPAFSAHSIMHTPSDGESMGMGMAVTVYKSPTCGCCGAWAEHMEENGFRVTEVGVSDLAEVKAKHGVPDSLMSCHTAVIGDLVVEGHVPASDIQAYLDNPEQDFAGLALPGMPMGSPGMDMPGHSQDFTVMGFNDDGSSEAYSEHIDD